MNNITAIPDQSIKTGVILALIASLCSTLMSVFVKLIGSGQSVSTIVFARFATGLVILLPWLLSDERLFAVDNKIKVVLRCVTSIMTMVCVFYSLKFMPVANVLLLNNTFPLFLPILSFLLLGLKTPMKMLVGVLTGFVGVALVLHPSASNFNWHALIALLSGLLAALAMLQIRLLTRGSSAKQILFYLFAFGTLASGIVMPFSFDMPTHKELGLLLLVGVCGTGYQVFLTLALTYARARIVSPIYFSCIVFAAFFDWLIWSIHLGYMELLGMGLIISGGLLTMLLAE